MNEAADEAQGAACVRRIRTSYRDRYLLKTCQKGLQVILQPLTIFPRTLRCDNTGRRADATEQSGADTITVVIVGCGKSAPIKLYMEQSSSLYPIYTNPSLSLYKLFQFNVNFGLGDTKNPKAYTADLGSKSKQFWGSTWNGLMHVEHINSVGPKAQNGGEMILEQSERHASVYEPHITLTFGQYV